MDSLFGREPGTVTSAFGYSEKYDEIWPSSGGHRKLILRCRSEFVMKYITATFALLGDVCSLSEILKVCLVLSLEL